MLFLDLALRRPSKRQIGTIFVISLTLIIFFGVLGDFRTGSTDLILALGQPTESFPEWLPTGFLWVYLYVTTPLNNLLNTIDILKQPDTISILATTAQLLPTFIRTAVYPASFLVQDVFLVDESLNVSTAFIDPFRDMGMAGVAIYSVFAGALGGLFWARRHRTYFLLGYAFIAQALCLSVFYNHLLYLPYLFQLFWFLVLLRGTHGPLRWSTVKTRNT